MKPFALMLLILVCASLAYGDISIGTYTIQPRFSHTIALNPFSELSVISSGAQQIASHCANAGDRRGCVQTQANALSTSQLRWSLDRCPSDVEIDRLYRQFVGVLSECNQRVSSACSCGAIDFPDLGETRIQVQPIGPDLHIELVKDGKSLSGYQKDVLAATIQEYDSKNKAVTPLDSLTLTNDNCEKKGYCTQLSSPILQQLHLVATPQGIAFLKDAESTKLPTCSFASPINKFELCVQSTQSLPRFSALAGRTLDTPLTYRFALTVGLVRRELKQSVISDSAVVAELENQIAKDEYSFDSDEERALFREYVLASAYQESRGFVHFDSNRPSGVVEGHDPGGSVGYGAMQITDPFHPDCFGKGGSGYCSASPECSGKNAYDLSCNIAAGVRYHYSNFQKAKSDVPVSYCGGSLSAAQLAMKYYNAGPYGTTNAGCPYVSIVDNWRDTIFEDEPIHTSSAPSTLPPVQPSTQPSNANIYILGDSLTVGYQNAGLESDLRAEGYSGVTINGLVGRSLSGAASAISNDADAIRNAGTIVIALGTNPSNPFPTQASDTIDALRALNPTARIVWVAVYYSTASGLQSTYAGYNTALASLATQKNIELITLQDILGQQKIDECISSDPGLIHPFSCYGEIAQTLATSLS